MLASNSYCTNIARWRVIPFGLTIGVMVSGYFLYHLIRSRLLRNRRVNPAIDKYVAEVIHDFDVEDLDDKTSFCRCWRSHKDKAFAQYYPFIKLIKQVGPGLQLLLWYNSRDECSNQNPHAGVACSITLQGQRKFPYCDGSHRKHNAMNRDNVGPLIIKKIQSQNTLFHQQ
ncbi:CDGSH iron-sulfur domain-containing protein 1-like isoform X2 [Narcine bancroftii]|uniref:CDGSH iron-sulfur domain-containing protein 1-like isoform X2 n=1 Tax=Narcine bancroftii TaxID=1343680 RepID=UPI003831461A